MGPGKRGWRPDFLACAEIVSKEIATFHTDMGEISEVPFDIV